MINPKSEEVWPIKPVDEDILNDRFENSKCVLVSGTRQVFHNTFFHSYKMRTLVPLIFCYICFKICNFIFN
jgi:hypothetical protein